MPLNANELARRHAGTVECRPEPLRVNWTLPDLATADSHTIDARFSCSARIADSNADRRMFTEVFLSSADSVGSDTIVRHFAAALKSAMTKLAAQQPASELVGATSRETWILEIARQLKPVAFACGLELLAPFQLDIESPSLQRQRIQEVVRTRASEQIHHAAELLKEFQQLRHAAPDVPAGKLLEQISPADRGRTLQTLLMASAGEAQPPALWAVAGPYLVRIDPRQAPPRSHLFQLPADLGPLRSVQPGRIRGKKALLIGARSGVIVAEPDNPQNVELYATNPPLDSPLGFNRVACIDDEVWGSHGDAGIVGWRCGQTSAPAHVFPEASEPSSPSATGSSAHPSSSSLMMSTATRGGSASGPRNLEALPDSRRLIYSLGAQLVVREQEHRTTLPSQSHSDIVAIVPAGDRLVVAHQDGTLVLLDRATLEAREVRHRGGRLSTAGVLPWLGDVRILLANDNGPIDCIGLEDPILTEFLSPYRGLKAITATNDLLAAISPDRQRIIVWQTWDGQRPLGEIHLTSQTRHRVADVEFEGRAI